MVRHPQLYISLPAMDRVGNPRYARGKEDQRTRNSRGATSDSAGSVTPVIMSSRDTVSGPIAQPRPTSLRISSSVSGSIAVTLTLPPPSSPLPSPPPLSPLPVSLFLPPPPSPPPS